MLMNSFSIIVRYSKIFSERKLHTYDLGLPEQIVLMYLSTVDKINQDNIAKHFMIDKGAIAKTLGKLETKGFIERFENQENKRENLVSLSKKGEGIMEYMRQVLDEWNEYILDGLSEEDINNMNKITEKMAANVIKSMSKDGGISYDKCK